MSSEKTEVNAIVLSSMPVGESDRRLVLLSRELGKITVFSRGARSPKSSLLAASQPFAFGVFTILPGKSAYSLVKAEISHYFRELTEDLMLLSYGTYFLEFAAYFSEENMDGTEELSLLFYSLKALLSDAFDNRLVRRIFEMKTFVIDGAYPEVDRLQLSETARYTLSFIISSPLRQLYSFEVTEEALQEIEKVLDRYIRANIPREFKSLKLLA